ncbi:hypothetical protein Q8F55_003886 [Vanrija albida]|uniref:Uncharacterized protein n=1 Tax=Vanrija albida TaxID=181172 RepID=A0ABR3Q5K3_9TREE
MLAKSLVLALLASLAAAAPTAELDQSAHAQRGETNLAARDAGVSVRCFNQKGRQGDEIYYSANIEDMFPNQNKRLAITTRGPSDISCRLDRWGGWNGYFWVMWDNDNVGFPKLSDPRYTDDPGRNQYCVDSWVGAGQNIPLGISLNRLP